MGKHHILGMCVATCLAALSIDATAQHLSLVQPQTTYSVGETVEISYEGTQPGDDILLFHDLAIMPLAERLHVQQTNGIYNVPAVLQPGDYQATLLRGETSLAEVRFKVADFSTEAPHRIMLLSDIHVMGPDLVINPENTRYLSMLAKNRKLCKYSYEIFQTLCDSIRAIRPELVLISGDLTHDGELLSHQVVVEGLQQLLDEGIPTFVIPGNHDIENENGRVYDYGTNYRAENIKLTDFPEMYKNFGYADDARRDPNSLSYVVEPIPGLVLICIDDSRCPSKGNTLKEGEYGRIIQPTIDWIVEQADKAVAQGKRVIAMVHHQMLQHYEGQLSFFDSSATENGDSIARIFAAHGIKAVFTGHMHIPNSTKIWGENRNDSIVEISAASTISYPSQYIMLLVDEEVNRMDVVSRKLHTTPSLPDVQAAAQEQMRTTLPETVRTLTVTYRSTLNQVLQQFAGIPEFDNAIADIPESNDSLADIAYEAFGETLEKVLFTSSEGNENLKAAADEVIAQLDKDCDKACELIFDHQNADTRAFLATIFKLMVMEKAEPTLRSMLSDLSYPGTADENQTDDLYLTVWLKDDMSGIAPVINERADVAEAVYTLSGMKISGNVSSLPKGVYIKKRGTQTWKFLVK